MKIEKIKKVNGKYQIILENNEVITTYEEVLINCNILYKKNIDNDVIKKIKDETDYYDIYNKIVRLINNKLRSKYEINKLMEKEKINTIKQKKIIEELEKNNLINDKNYVRAYIHDKINLSNDGPLKIKNDLIKQQINIDIIENEISKINKNDVKSKLEKLILKKIKTNNKYSFNMLKYKIVDYFTNKGYERNEIINLYEKNKISNNEIIKKEYDKLYNKYSKKYENQELENIIRNKLYMKGFTFNEINEIMIKKR